MAYISQDNILNEYLNFIRTADLISVSDRGVTTTTDTFTSAATGAETFTLTHTNAKNIRSVTYDGAAITFVTNYTYDLDVYTVTLLAVTSGKAVVVSYDYGSGDKVYPDYPKPDLTISSFPRIGFGVYGFKSEVAGFSNVLKSNWRFDVRVYATTSKQADQLIDSLRTANIAAYVSLKYANRIFPGSVIDLGMFEQEKGKNKIYVKGLDVHCINEYEIN